VVNRGRRSQYAAAQDVASRKARNSDIGTGAERAHEGMWMDGMVEGKANKAGIGNGSPPDMSARYASRQFARAPAIRSAQVM